MATDNGRVTQCCLLPDVLRQEKPSWKWNLWQQFRFATVNIHLAGGGSWTCGYDKHACHSKIFICSSDCSWDFPFSFCGIEHHSRCQCFVSHNCHSLCHLKGVFLNHLSLSRIDIRLKTYDTIYLQGGSIQKLAGRHNSRCCDSHPTHNWQNLAETKIQFQPSGKDKKTPVPQTQSQHLSNESKETSSDSMKKKIKLNHKLIKKN